METEHHKNPHPHPQTLKLKVTFVAAGRPFEDDATSRSETIGQLKPRVLTAFGLQEGAEPDGTQVTYTLHFERQLLDNPSITLGSLAGDKDHLHLKLGKQVTQG